MHHGYSCEICYSQLCLVFAKTVSSFSSRSHPNILLYLSHCYFSRDANTVSFSVCYITHEIHTWNGNSHTPAVHCHFAYSVLTLLMVVPFVQMYSICIVMQECLTIVTRNFCMIDVIWNPVSFIISALSFRWCVGRHSHCLVYTKSVLCCRLSWLHSTTPTVLYGNIEVVFIEVVVFILNSKHLIVSLTALCCETNHTFVQEAVIDICYHTTLHWSCNLGSANVQNN